MQHPIMQGRGHPLDRCKQGNCGWDESQHQKKSISLQNTLQRFQESHKERQNVGKMETARITLA
jgi:hypothetical protein